MVLSKLFRTSRSEMAAAPLYRAIVQQAREPAFYAVHGVPDSLDGRFDMIAMHMFLVLQRLRSTDPARSELAQALFDTMFADMDRSLREIGVGDLAVGKRIRSMAEGLYGRIAAYEQGLAADDAILAAALRRNLFGTVADPGPSPEALQTLCNYLRAAVPLLAGQPDERFKTGEIVFPAAPAAR